MSRYRTYPELQEAPLCLLIVNTPKSFGCFWIWYKRNYTVFPLLCLTFFCSILYMGVSSMYLHISVVYSFYCWVISYCMNISHVFIHSPMVAIYVVLRFWLGRSFLSMHFGTHVHIYVCVQGQEWNYWILGYSYFSLANCC